MKTYLKILGGTVLVIGVLTAGVPTQVFAVGGIWALTGSLKTARVRHTATLLSNGHVLVTGGEHNQQAIASTEIYGPIESSWTDSGDLNVARSRASAALLPDERVIVAGGCTGACKGSTIASAELFDRKSGAWSSTGDMVTARADFGMMVLPDGRVLVAGGCIQLKSHGCGAVTASAEIYDPAGGSWTSTEPMKVARGSMTVTLLQNGTVLVAGGFDRKRAALGTAEIYDPVAGTWTLTGDMNVARSQHAAVLLEDGTVLVAGGVNAAGMSTPKTEWYDPVAGTWTATANLNGGRFEHTATLLGNGNVLVAGGTKATGKSQRVLSNAEVYNPVTGVWLRTGRLTAPRTGHSATLMGSGQVLATAGKGRNKNLPTAEIYTP